MPRRFPYPEISPSAEHALLSPNLASFLGPPFTHRLLAPAVWPAGVGGSWGAAGAEEGWRAASVARDGGQGAPEPGALPGVMGSGFPSHPRASPLPGAAMPRWGLPAWLLAGLLLALCGECRPWVLAGGPAP